MAKDSQPPGSILAGAPRLPASKVVMMSEISFTRSAPEDVSDFFPGFLLEWVKGRAHGQRLTDELMASLKIDIVAMMRVAVDLYGLPIRREADDFWSIRVDENEGGLLVTIVPEALQHCSLDLKEGDDSVRLAIESSPFADEAGLFVVAPSVLQAHIGLARMVEMRRVR
jgi:hypothetical protein